MSLEELAYFAASSPNQAPSQQAKPVFDARIAIEAAISVKITNVWLVGATWVLVVISVISTLSGTS